ncbi:MAG: zinc ribbon domain-containing protein [Oscillospiraceae bacterium]|nr:zinc ribbon domain-containing protein [Oscillospiraceae bacterium]
MPNIFDTIRGTFDSATKGVSENAKNAAEVNNLKRKILYEEERIVEVFADIGKKYYKNPDEDRAVLKVLCDDVDTRRKRIMQMRKELNSIRGFKICPKCDAEVDQKFQYCNLCGAKLLDPDEEEEFGNTMEQNDYFTESDSFFSADTIKSY